MSLAVKSPCSKVRLYPRKIEKEQPNPCDWLVLKPSSQDWKQLGKLQTMVVEKLAKMGICKDKIVKTTDHFAHITLLLNVRGKGKNGSFTSPEIRKLMKLVAQVAGKLLPMELEIKNLNPVMSCGRPGDRIGRCVYLHLTAEKIVELHKKLFEAIFANAPDMLDNRNIRAILENANFEVRITVAVISTDTFPLCEDNDAVKLNKRTFQKTLNGWFRTKEKEIFCDPIKFAFNSVKLIRVNDPKAPDREKQYLTLAECSAGKKY